MPFQPGNQLAVGHGRPKGSGKSALFRQWCEEKGIARLFDLAEGKGHGFESRNGKIVEIGPNYGIQLEALRLALAYGLGRPVVPFVVDDRSRNPEESRRRADEVLQMIQDLEKDANNGTETGSDRGSVGDRAT